MEKGKWKRTSEFRKKLSEIAKANGQVPPSPKGRSLSAETKKKLSLHRLGKPQPWNKGEKNGNWQGGITPINLKIRDSIEFADWRKAVFTRDNFTCQGCGKTGVYIHAHHIFSFSDYPELRFTISNGITLCTKCHKETENYGGRGQKRKIYAGKTTKFFSQGV